ncbi:MAG: type I-B CRISPR-associated protein Cas7/Csh2 [Thermoprotei archaeon]
MEEGLTNSEILLIYEAKMCNPNGDPDAENKPRIDPKTNINLVTDVRLKRFFRDYIVEKFGENYVYVTKIAGENVTAEERVKMLLRNLDEESLHKVLERCIDARLFGATMTIKEKPKSFIGPVQFTWGFSFHKVEVMDTSAITSVFSGAVEKYGTIGRDWRVYYSLIGFYGVVSGRRAKVTGMSQNDLKVFDNLIWKALEVQPTTRSKIGERPHLYMRIEYKDADTVLGDLRRFIVVNQKGEAIRDFKDLDINFNELVNNLERNKDVISKLYLRTSEELSFVEKPVKSCCPEKFSKLPHELTDAEIKAVIERT